MTVDPVRRADRRGFTLVELLVSMVLISVIGGAIVKVFTNQQAFLRSTSDLGTVRNQLQTAASILPADLRSVSTAGGDIIAMTDSSITVRTTIAVSIACTGVAGGTVLTLLPSGTLTAPNNAAVTARFSSSSLTPAAGDSVFIWDEGATTAASDDQWVAANGAPYVIANNGVASTVGACPDLGTYAPAGTLATRAATVLTLTGALRTSFANGAPVRVTRRVRYGLYQSSVDGKWYLGFWMANSNLVGYQYVAGPFRSYSATGASGLRFRYYTAAGAEIVDMTRLTDVARIDITARAESEQAISLGGKTAKIYSDSAQVAVSIRNRT